MIKLVTVIIPILLSGLLGCSGPLEATELAPEAAPTAPEPANDARIGRLIEGLKGWNRAQIQANADTLTKIGEPAVPRLIEALKNEDPGVRSGAARILGEIEAKEASAALGELLTDTQHWVTRTAVFSLGRIGSPEAVGFLKKALSHYRGGVQEAALWGLDELLEKSAIPEIGNLMVSSSDQYVRWKAMQVLRSLQEGEEITVLIRTLNDPEAADNARRNAVAMLGTLEISSAVPGLLQALDSEDAGLRWRAIEALGKIGSLPARTAIEAKLADQDGDVRMFAIGALGLLGSPESVNALKPLLSSPSSPVRLNTLRSLRRIGDPESAAAIRGALADKEPSLRTMAIEALVELRAVEAADEIKLLAADQSPAVRTAVMRALGELSPDSSRETLEKGKTDSNPWVRYEAGRAGKKSAPVE